MNACSCNEALHEGRKSDRRNKGSCAMNVIVDRMVQKLSERGLTEGEIPRLLRDALLIVNKELAFQRAYINQELTNLGWEKDLLDRTSLELMLLILVRNAAYPEPRRPTSVFASFW